MWIFTFAVINHGTRIAFRSILLNRLNLVPHRQCGIRAVAAPLTPIVLESDCHRMLFLNWDHNHWLCTTLQVPQEALL